MPTTTLKMNVRVEETHHLPGDELHAAICAADLLGRRETLDEVAAELRAWFPDWFVYEGGSHVALHRTKNSDRRIMIITKR